VFYVQNLEAKDFNEYAQTATTYANIHRFCVFKRKCSNAQKQTTGLNGIKLLMMLT